MKVCKILEIQCFVLNAEMNDLFEDVLTILMVPVKAFNPDTNTYTIHATFKLWSYIQRECRFRNITVLPQDGFRKCVVNSEEYALCKAENKNKNKLQ